MIDTEHTWNATAAWRRTRPWARASRRLKLIAFSSAVLALGGGLASAATYYVATNGSDSASGTLAAPFATLEKARNTLTAGDTVYVRGGVYLRTNTFTLTSANSGASAVAPTVYRNYTNETPILCGGLPLINWASWQTNIMVTDASTQGFSGIHFRQLYCNGAGQQLARYPNYNGIGTNSYSFVVRSGSTSQFTYKAGDIHSYANPTEVQVFMFSGADWGNDIVSISSISGGIVYLNGNTEWAMGAGNRYFVQNAFEELDTAGEWYLDSMNKYLYFYPSNTITASTPIYAPIVTNLLTMSSGAANITFQGFTLEYCAGTAIALTGTSNCLIAANTILNVGDYNGSGVTVSGGFTNGVVGNDVSYVGNHGISLKGGTTLTLTPANNYADNNYIHDIGVFNKADAGVWLQGVGNRASHNLIFNCPRWGVALAYGANLHIEYNNIYSCMLETDDGAPIYGMAELWNPINAWLSCRGSVVAMNYVHDCTGYGFSGVGYITAGLVEGIYLDELVNGVNVFSNIVCRMSNAGIYLHAGRDNWVKNNIICNCTNAQVEYVGDTTSSSVWTTYYNNMLSSYNAAMTNSVWTTVRGMSVSPAITWPSGYTMGGNVFATNIVYYLSPGSTDLGMYYNLTLSSNAWNYNTVYAHGITICDVTGTSYNWSAWQGQGCDLNSAVGDPLFTSPSTGDYSLQPSSPALTLGFRQFSMAQIGPYQSSLRASWPIFAGPEPTNGFVLLPPSNLRVISGSGM